MTTQFAVRVTVEAHPPMTDPAADSAAAASAYEAELPDVPGEVIRDYSPDGRFAAFVTTHQAGEFAIVGLATAVLKAAGQAMPSARIVALELLDAAERDRRLTTHGWPAPGDTPPAHDLPADLGALVAAIPQVVDSTDFAALLGVSTSRIRQLRGERAAAAAIGADHPFPAECDQLPGYWLRADAEAYRDSDRPGPGRPKASTR